MRRRRPSACPQSGPPRPHEETKQLGNVAPACATGDGGLARGVPGLEGGPDLGGKDCPKEVAATAREMQRPQPRSRDYSRWPSYGLFLMSPIWDFLFVLFPCLTLPKSLELLGN